MRCQFAEILNDQILTYEILSVGTHSIHLCSLKSSLIFIYKVNYIYLFFFFLHAWYAQWPRTLWIHSPSSTWALQECQQAEECSFFKTRMPTSWGVFFENLLVGDWPILCGHEQAFQGPPRTSQNIAARQSLTAKKSFSGPQSATCGRVGLTTLKTPRSIPWCARVSAKPVGSPVWSSAEATSAGRQ